MVREGDLLVSGLVHLRLDEKTMLAHSTADIYARVWHQSTAATPVNGYAKVPTGKKSVRYALSLGKFRINFYKDGRKPFDKYDKISNRYEVELSDGSTLPFALIRETYYEYETYAAPLDEQEHAQPLPPPRRTWSPDRARAAWCRIWAYASGCRTAYCMPARRARACKRSE